MIGDPEERATAPVRDIDQVARFGMGTMPPDLLLTPGKTIEGVRLSPVGVVCRRPRPASDLDILFTQFGLCRVGFVEIQAHRSQDGIGLHELDVTIFDDLDPIAPRIQEV